MSLTAAISFSTGLIKVDPKLSRHIHKEVKFSYHSSLSVYFRRLLNTYLVVPAVEIRDRETVSSRGHFCGFNLAKHSARLTRVRTTLHFSFLPTFLLLISYFLLRPPSFSSFNILFPFNASVYSLGLFCIKKNDITCWLRSFTSK